MYNSFFGFKCKPFQLTPDPEFLFMSPVHKRALTYLSYGVKDNYGFILLTGEIGTGKTTVIRTLMRQITAEMNVARITNTKVSSDQLISMINDDFGLDTKDKDKIRMLADLTDYLIKQYAEGGRSILIIDEAQNLAPDLLEEVRLLSNLETDKSNLLQIILIGQPELNTTLGRHELEQLRQRIAINVYIRRLARNEVEDYIRHRLKVAGNENGVRFEEGVIDAIYEFSSGVPRLINIICEFTLLSAFVEKKSVIDIELIREIMVDLINESPETRAASASPQPSPGNLAQENIRESLDSIHLRLQNLEAVLYEVQKRVNLNEDKSLLPNTITDDLITTKNSCP
jgi:general secretion pathway protein A